MFVCEVVQSYKRHLDILRKISSLTSDLTLYIHSPYDISLIRDNFHIIDETFIRKIFLLKNGNKFTGNLIRIWKWRENVFLIWYSNIFLIAIGEMIRHVWDLMEHIWLLIFVRVITWLHHRLMLLVMVLLMQRRWSNLVDEASLYIWTRLRIFIWIVQNCNTWNL